MNFATFTQLHIKSEHSDLAQTKDGKDTYVLADYNSGFVAMVDMASGVKTNLFELYGPSSSSTSIHISGTSKNKPGYVTIGFYGCKINYGSAPCPFNTQWFNDKMVVVELKANPKIYNVGHTHFGDAGYFAETQGTANPDLTKILFVSTWGSTNVNDVTSYMISLPPSALP